MTQVRKKRKKVVIIKKKVELNKDGTLVDLL